MLTKPYKYKYFFEEGVFLGQQFSMWRMKADQVDKLREVAGRILYADEDFQSLVRKLGGKIPEPSSRPSEVKSP
jgi:hypothetical protein